MFTGKGGSACDDDETNSREREREREQGILLPVGIISPQRGCPDTSAVSGLQYALPKPHVESLSQCTPKCSIAVEVVL